MTFTGSTFLQILLVQRLLDYTPAQAGVVLLPGSLMLALSFPLAGRVADKYDRRVIMLGALSVCALSSYLFTFVNLARPLSWFIGLILLRYSCASFVYAPMTAAALAQLAPEKVRMGSGLLYLMQHGLGHTLGLALMTTVLQHRLTYHWSVLDLQLAGATGPLGDTPALAPLRYHVNQQATVAAYQDCFMLVTLLSLASMLLVILIRKPVP